MFSGYKKEILPKIGYSRDYMVIDKNDEIFLSAWFYLVSRTSITDEYNDMKRWSI